MRGRWLGRTNHKAKLFSLGGESVIKSDSPDDHDEAMAVLNEALDLGVNYIDTAPAYGNGTSEENIGQLGRRSEYYLATKCDKRHASTAWRQINESIERLGSTPDCIQVHHLDEMWEVDRIFDPKKGAMKSLLRAQREGLCKYLGITGHSDPTVLLEALSRHPFDTVLGAVNVADPYAYSFQARLIPYCNKNNIGFIAMKVTSRGGIFQKNGISTMEECLNYVWSIPGVHTAIVGVMNVEQLRRNVELAEQFVPLEEIQLQQLEQRVEPYSSDVLYFRKHHEWQDVDMPQFVL